MFLQLRIGIPLHGSWQHKHIKLSEMPAKSEGRKLWQTSRTDRKHLPNASVLTLFYWHEVSRWSQHEMSFSATAPVCQRSISWSKLAFLPSSPFICWYFIPSPSSSFALWFNLWMRLTFPQLSQPVIAVQHKTESICSFATLFVHS